MWYKEWTILRFKFWLWLLAYLPFALFFILVTYQSHYIQLLTWISWVYFVTVPAALLGGMDVVADEIDKGTLGFLLTKPLTRHHIYNSKLLMNIAVLGVVYSGTNLLVLVFDQFREHHSSLFEALALLLLGWLLGSTLICLAALISIFASNSIRTLSYSLVVVGGASLALVIIYTKYLASLDIAMSAANIVLCAYLLLGALAVGFYRAGLFCFEHRGF
jgi:ABC-type transport system involved in multi-copper enzyme maturation permease subunit